MNCDLAIVGGGLAGLSAGVFAAERGISTLIVGGGGAGTFASGLLDLLGVYPLAKKRMWQNPWAGIEALAKNDPKHPYTRLKQEEIRTSFDVILAALAQEGLHYRRRKNANVEMITPIGTIRPAYCVPETMWPAVESLKSKHPCLLIDIEGLRGFSARQLHAVLSGAWPGLTHGRICFPGFNRRDEVFTEPMALYLENPLIRKTFADRIQPLIGKVRAVGLPALLGIHRTAEVAADLEKKLGVPVFEIPTMPPSVPALRLVNALRRQLAKQGVRIFSHLRVTAVNRRTDGAFELFVADKSAEPPVGNRIVAQTILIASGRFLGGGLQADRKGVRETLFNLPVFQPEARKDWHRRDFLDPRGHPINQAGLEVDSSFRVVNASGKPVHERIFAAGSILAHQDWMRMHCGAGLSFATAYGAVRGLTR